MSRFAMTVWRRFFPLLIGCLGVSLFGENAADGPSKQETLTWLNNNRDRLAYAAKGSLDQSLAGENNYQLRSGRMLSEFSLSPEGVLSFQIWTEDSWGSHESSGHTYSWGYEPPSMDFSKRISSQHLKVPLNLMDPHYEVIRDEFLPSLFVIKLRALRQDSIELSATSAAYDESGERINSAKRTRKLKVNGEANVSIAKTGYNPAFSEGEAAVWLDQWSRRIASKTNALLLRTKDEESALRIAKALSHLIRLHGGKEDNLFK